MGKATEISWCHHTFAAIKRGKIRGTGPTACDGLPRTPRGGLSSCDARSVYGCQSVSGSVLATAKRRAGQLGISLEEYQALRSSGQRWCTACKAWHGVVAFGRDRTTYDGLANSCLASRSTGTGRGAPKGRASATKGRRFKPREGDERQARAYANLLVRTGRLPRPNALPCTDCGHTYAPGERRHEYDHYLGYAVAHHGDVQAVCSTCHHKREVSRGATWWSKR
jgi:hypothetical protein